MGGAPNFQDFTLATSGHAMNAANSVGSNLNSQLQVHMQNQASLNKTSHSANAYQPPKPEPTVAQTAASRVKKSPSEAMDDAKDAELAEWVDSLNLPEPPTT